MMSRPAIVHRGACLLGGLLLGQAALAQDAGILLNEQIRQQVDAARVPAAQESVEASEPLPAPADASGNAGSVSVRRLVFTGEAELLSAEDRQALDALALGKRLDLGGLQALADRATQRLQQQGALLAYANLPPQDVTEGEVVLEIHQGSLSGIEIEAGTTLRLRRERIEAIGDRVLSKGATRDTLTAALLRLNDLPGISARGSLSPGATPDSSVLTLRVEEDKPVSFVFSGNNYGVESTGTTQGAATLRLNNLSGHGDSSALSYSRAEGQDYLAFSGELPLGATPFTATTSYSHLDYEHQTEPGTTLGLEGTTRRVTLGLDYALLRSRALRLDLQGSYLQQALQDKALAGTLSDKNIDAWRLGLSGDVRDALGAGGVTLFNAMLTAGDLDLSGVPAALAADQATLNTHGDFRRLNLDLVRYQYLPHNFTLYARFYGQWVNRNLDSSQQLSLGGPYGLRGWPVAEAQGDSGVLGTLELRYRVPQLSSSTLQLAAFLDAGRIRIHDDPAGVPMANACACNRYSLKSAGVNLSWQYRNLSVDASWARGLGNNPGRSVITGLNSDGNDDRQQVWLRLGLAW